MKHYTHIFTNVDREYNHTRGPFATRSEARQIAEHVCLEDRCDGESELTACVSIWNDPERAVRGDINYSPEWFAPEAEGCGYKWHRPGKFDFGEIEIVEAATRDESK